ncbi:hypothetical protein SLEP1_g26697 [Rubroshorea leprosula]|uniref:F-box protein n=1 Tax=Rubroshorea leprosula TaxID=152421 RepID=A0AAV5JWJ6_9ROSI|nr:hypothetical protein SLEP1_g26697 [Rubroshorea leprosula]
MASLLSSSSSSCCSCSMKSITTVSSIPKLPVRISVPQSIPTKELIEGLRIGDGFRSMENNVNVPVTTSQDQETSASASIATLELYAVLEAVADRVEMHHNIGEQRENWNTLLLNSINMITLTATTMAGVAAATGAGSEGGSILGLNLASTILFSTATGMLVLMNKIQPSQLVEEQRNATRFFKQLQSQIQTKLALGSQTKEDVEDAMEKVLALDKAFPLPLLGAMLEKFPKTFSPAVWWPRNSQNRAREQTKTEKTEHNGWNSALEMEMREIVNAIKRKDIEDYERLGNIVLKINKILAVSGPLLTGIAAIGSAHGGSWAATMAAVAGALATTVNTLEHGAQVGMVFEMYRSCAGFFTLTEETIESTLGESDVERRENGELFQMKVGLQLGRSLSQLKELAKKSRYSRIEGSTIDEFASKLF